MRCSFCGRSLEVKSAWKGAASQFYCGEFCADSEAAESAPAAASLLQHHLNQPYERLQRLLPYMRQYSGRASPAAAHR
jgi:hypothetical protein